MRLGYFFVTPDKVPWRISRIVLGKSSREAYHHGMKHVPMQKTLLPWKTISLLLGNGIVLGTYGYYATASPSVNKTRWNPEWDVESRPKPVTDTNAAPKSSPSTRRGFSCATKQIILIRHGQYKNPYAANDDVRGLTQLGVEQAHLVGQYLSQLVKNRKVRGIFHSDLKRARETAAIVSTYIKEAKCIEDPRLAEGVPAKPDPPILDFNPTDIEIAADSSRIESAFRSYFHRPPPPDRNPVYDEEFDVYDIIVCHGNVIRYMFCRALQFPCTAWLRLAIFNCGVTWISIDDTGYVSARELGNVGFIPFSKVTYT